MVTQYIKIQFVIKSSIKEQRNRAKEQIFKYQLHYIDINLKQIVINFDVSKKKKPKTYSCRCRCRKSPKGTIFYCKDTEPSCLFIPSVLTRLMHALIILGSCSQSQRMKFVNTYGRQAGERDYIQRKERTELLVHPCTGKATM